MSRCNHTPRLAHARPRDKHWNPKRSFDIFPATYFLPAAVQHIPPKGSQTIMCYGLYSNKTGGMAYTDHSILIPAQAPVPKHYSIRAHAPLPARPMDH